MIADGARAASKENVRIQVCRTAIPIGNSSARWRISSQKDARLALLIRPEESTSALHSLRRSASCRQRAAPIFRPPCSARQRRRGVDHFGRMTRGTIIVDRTRRFSRTCERIVRAQRRASASLRRRRTCSLSISRSRRRIWMRCPIRCVALASKARIIKRACKAASLPRTESSARDEGLASRTCAFDASAQPRQGIDRESILGLIRCLLTTLAGSAYGVGIAA